jgi:hypothetical protein
MFRGSREFTRVRADIDAIQAAIREAGLDGWLLYDLHARNDVAAHLIGLGVVWVLAVENLVSAVAGSVLTALQPLRDLMPGTNAGSLVHALTARVATGAATPGVTDAVSGGRAVLTLAVYVALSATVAAVALRRRDVA